MSDYGFIRRRYEGEMMTSFIWWNVYSSANADWPLKYFHIGLYLKGFARHISLSIRFRRVKGVDKPIRIFTDFYKWTDEDVARAGLIIHGRQE